MFHFKEAEYFKADDPEVRAVPTVAFPPPASRRLRPRLRRQRPRARGLTQGRRSASGAAVRSTCQITGITDTATAASSRSSMWSAMIATLPQRVAEQVTLVVHSAPPMTV